VGQRAVRHYYERDGDRPPTITIDPDFEIAFEPWSVHRARFESELRHLDPADWDRPTRCTEWSVREVVGHLVVVDGFWAFTLGNARDGVPPLTMLEGFDPSSSTDDLVKATLTTPVSELLDQFSAAAATTTELLSSFTKEQWRNRTESPLGHLPPPILLGHMLWDSWLHERDILEPMNAAPTSPAEELLAVTWFSLCFSGLQGGLLGDPNPAGPGPDAVIDATLAFDDLPDTALRVRIDDGIEIVAADPQDAIPVGSAAAFVDAFGGRRSTDEFGDVLPADLFAQLTRARLALV
jgi:uncharacterized protein (TIGR03083 family)